jgi:hypothetical protein
MPRVVRIENHATELSFNRLPKTELLHCIAPLLDPVRALQPIALGMAVMRVSASDRILQDNDDVKISAKQLPFGRR